MSEWHFNNCQKHCQHLSTNVEEMHYLYYLTVIKIINWSIREKKMLICLRVVKSKFTSISDTYDENAIKK